MSSVSRQRNRKDNNMLPHWKHLTLEQRVEIAHGLAHDEPLGSIAERIGLDPTSVSKEIKRNRTQTSPGSGECKRLGRFPFVCDNCPRKYGRSKCGCAKFRYDARAAQAKADRRLVQSRQGIDCDESEFRLVDDAIVAGLAARKSVYEITRDPEVAKVASQQTVYRWVSLGITTAKKPDLPMAVRYKKRKAKAYEYGGSSKGKEGRSYLDYLAHRRANPGEFGCQMDFLGSVATDKKAILTVSIPELHFVYVRLLPKNDPKAVRSLWDWADGKIGREAFKRVFSFILTDNDPCFSDFASIEADGNGEIRTRMFFADPYVSNQKGSVENMNGQLRLHFPKGKSVDGLSEERVREANEAMIDRPLKSLGGKTPREAFEAVYGEGIIELLLDYVKPKE